MATNGMIRAKRLAGEDTTVLNVWRTTIRNNAPFDHIAEELGTYQPERISRIFTGSEQPTIQLMKRLCNLTGAKLGDIFEYDPTADADGEDKED